MAWASEQKTGSSTKKLILLMLADRANESGLCFPSQKRLAEDCELNKSTIQKNIKLMEENGLVKIIHRFKDSVQLPNHYQLNIMGYSIKKVGVPSQKGTEPINEPITDVSTNTSENNKEHQEQEQEHTQLWIDYSLGFLKRKGRSSSEIGSKAKSLARYIKLCKKGVSYSAIREVVNQEASKSFGNKHLENILSPTYFKDHYNGV